MTVNPPMTAATAVPAGTVQATPGFATTMPAPGSGVVAVPPAGAMGPQVQGHLAGPGLALSGGQPEIHAAWGASQEKRLRDLEKKLDRLMEQMQSLHKERGRSLDDEPRRP